MGGARVAGLILKEFRRAGGDAVVVERVWKRWRVAAGVRCAAVWRAVTLRPPWGKTVG